MLTYPVELEVYFMSVPSSTSILWKNENVGSDKSVSVQTRSGSRISGKWVYMYKGVGGFTLLILSHFS